VSDHVLLSSPPSPFGRKVKIAAAVLGLADRIEVIQTDTGQTGRLQVDNPLGKIPVLIPAGGEPIYDSRVILEYLDILAGGGRIVPGEPAARIAALRLQALGDGIMDAALLRRYETIQREPHERSAKWDANQAAKIARGLAALEAAPPPLDTIGVGEITVACALGYLDLRFEGTWRADHPRLVAWLDAFAARVPSFAKTKA
jgi:glutathione S-transferase